MKTLQVAVLHDSNSDMYLMNHFANDHTAYNFTYYTDVEKTIEASSAQQFDLLIIEKSLDKNIIDKVEKVIDLLHPNAATTLMEFNDAEFISFKLGQLYKAWQEANNGERIIYHDNSKLN